MTLDFNKLQEKQQQHDLIYHQDILVLGTHERVKHLVLHFAKYLGKFTENPSSVEEQLVSTDFMICSISLANVLNIRLSEVEANNSTLEYTTEMLLKNITCIVGKLAKACEALDHVEDYPSRSTLEQSLESLVSCLISLSKNKKIDLNSEIPKRLNDIELNSIFSKKQSPSRNLGIKGRRT